MCIGGEGNINKKIGNLAELVNKLTGLSEATFTPKK